MEKCLEISEEKPARVILRKNTVYPNQPRPDLKPKKVSRLLNFY